MAEEGKTSPNDVGAVGRSGSLSTISLGTPFCNISNFVFATSSAILFTAFATFLTPATALSTITNTERAFPIPGTALTPFSATLRPFIVISETILLATSSIFCLSLSSIKLTSGGIALRK